MILQKQEPLEKWKNKDSSKHSVTGEVYIWMDPIQTQVLNDQNPMMIIYGPASTGKTVLIQLKIIQLIKGNKNSKILVLLPHKRLVLKYKQFFDWLNLDFEAENVRITTPEGPWELLVSKNDSHIFIDEFMSFKFCSKNIAQKLNDLLKKFDWQHLFWISLDFKQSNYKERTLPLQDLNFHFPGELKVKREVHDTEPLYLELP